MARPIGVDISKYQAPSDLSKPHGISFATMVDKADFLIVRAGFAGSAGGAWTDPRVNEYMEDLWDILTKRPIPFTFYWYFRDDVSIMDQVNRFSSVVNRWKEVVNLPLVVDAEAFAKGNAVSTQKIVDFQYEVERNCGLDVEILYGRAGQLNAETVPGLERAEVCPSLWIARYTSKDAQTSEPWDEGGYQEYVEPRDWDTWKIWQYSEDGDEKAYGVTAGARGIDLNVFNGTQEELRSWAKLDEREDPEGVWGSMQVRSEGKATSQVQLYTMFPPEDASRPELLSLAFGKGEIGTINVFAVIGGVPFKLTQVSAKYKSFYFMELPTMWLSKDDYVLVEFLPLVHAQTVCKVAWL